MSGIVCPDTFTVPPPRQYTLTNHTKHIPHGRCSPRLLVPLPSMRTTISLPGVFAASSGNRLKQPMLLLLISIMRYGTWLKPMRSNRTKTTGQCPPYNLSLNRPSGFWPNSPPPFNGTTLVSTPSTNPPIPLLSLRQSNVLKHWSRVALMKSLDASKHWSRVALTKNLQGICPDWPQHVREDQPDWLRGALQSNSGPTTHPALGSGPMGTF
jgi:hypothetical protein